MTPDKEQVVQPLSAEEEADYRYRFTNGGSGAHVDSRDIARLLATLDAVREQRDRWEAEASHQFTLRGAAARTASVAGLDRERLAAALRSETVQNDLYHILHDAPTEARLVKAADTIANAYGNSAPSIEQEPGEAPWLVGHEECAREADRLRGVIAAFREQEPGETLRAAAYAERALRHWDIGAAACREQARGDRSSGWMWRAEAIESVVRGLRAALEADRNPQETERPGRDDLPTIDPVDNGRNDR